MTKFPFQRVFDVLHFPLPRKVHINSTWIDKFLKIDTCILLWKIETNFDQKKKLFLQFYYLFTGFLIFYNWLKKISAIQKLRFTKFCSLFVSHSGRFLIFSVFHGLRIENLASQSFHPPSPKK